MGKRWSAEVVPNNYLTPDNQHWKALLVTKIVPRWENQKYSIEHDSML